MSTALREQVVGFRRQELGDQLLLDLLDLLDLLSPGIRDRVLLATRLAEHGVASQPPRDWVALIMDGDF